MKKYTDPTELYANTIIKSQVTYSYKMTRKIIFFLIILKPVFTVRNYKANNVANSYQNY